MSLFDEHKAERRARIGKAARKLLVERGYAGLTMRDLASAARVAVPTLYNLFGSKDAIVGAELEANLRDFAARQLPPSDGFFAVVMNGFDVGMRLIEDSPDFYRACMQMFLTSPDTREMRHQLEDGHIAIMAGNLAAAKAADQFADWADPKTVASHVFAQYMSAFLAWSLGELDLPSFRNTALSGVCHLLLGVARGRFARDLEAKLRTLPKPVIRTEVPRAASR